MATKKTSIRSGLQKNKDNEFFYTLYSPILLGILVKLCAHPISTGVQKLLKSKCIDKLRTFDIIPTHSQKDFRSTSISRMESKKSLSMTKELMTVFLHFFNPKCHNGFPSRLGGLPKIKMESPPIFSIRVWSVTRDACS